VKLGGSTHGDGLGFRLSIDPNQYWFQVVTGPFSDIAPRRCGAAFIRLHKLGSSSFDPEISPAGEARP
jgi:hypothetical protein